MSAMLGHETVIMSALAALAQQQAPAPTQNGPEAQAGNHEKSLIFARN
jgi:hypothetical protein